MYVTVGAGVPVFPSFVKCFRRLLSIPLQLTWVLEMRLLVQSIEHVLLFIFFFSSVLYFLHHVDLMDLELFTPDSLIQQMTGRANFIQWSTIKLSKCTKKLVV